jgi:hypothetical protein
MPDAASAVIDSRRAIGEAIAIGLVAGLVAATVWLLVFTQFAIVTPGVSYPDDWLAMTSQAQVDWLREHTVVLTGFTALEYIATHFSNYSKTVTMVVGSMLFSALCTSGLAWFVWRREH